MADKEIKVNRNQLINNVYFNAGDKITIEKTLDNIPPIVRIHFKKFLVLKDFKLEGEKLKRGMIIKVNGENG